MMRPSTETAIETGVSYIVILLVGLFLMLGGGFAAYLGYREATVHTTHIAIGAGVSVFGALVLLVGIARKMGVGVLQTIIINVSPFVPKFGGQRAGDPPMPPESKP